MYQSVTANTDLTVDGHQLPLSNLTGPHEELRQLHQWTWLQYLSEGIRIHALAGRWPDAVRHATNLRGIGLHLMEGRQAAIVAHLLDHDPEGARAVLDSSTVTQPWEQQVRSCLAAMCSTPSTRPSTIGTMIDQFRRPYDPVDGYAVYRARLGLTTVTLAVGSDPATAQDTLRQLTDEIVDASDGYAAREVLGHRTTLQMDVVQRAALVQLVEQAGLGAGAIPTNVCTMLTEAVSTAELALATAIG